MRAALAMFRGDAAAALHHYRRACELNPDHPGCYAATAAALGLAGDIAGADATMTDVHRRFSDRILSPYVLAIVETRCGRHGAAMRLLAQATRQRDPNLVVLLLEPSFRDLHADPRWPAVLAAALPLGAEPGTPRD